MSFGSRIQRFLDDVDPKILARGEDYYRSGQVKRIDWDGGHVTARISGSEEEPYLAGLTFSEDGEVESWSCDCPYDWGPVCKHMVAVLLAIQAKAPKKLPQKSADRKINIRPLVEKAEKEQLVALVLEHCQEDLRFQSRVLSELEDSGEEELAAVYALIKASIRSNTYRGFIDKRGCDNICADMDEALDQARRRVQRGQNDRALDITLFVLLMAVKLAGEADGSSGTLRYTIEAAMETVRLSAGGAAGSGEPRGTLAGKIIKAAEDPVFDGWDNWRYDLLQRAAVLADTENEQQFYDLLDRLNDQLWGSFQDGPEFGYEKEEKITRYCIMRSAHGAEEARTYLEQNLDVDEFRLILVREEMEKGAYAQAERLCRERLEIEDAAWWYRPSQWQYLLYEVYRDWGQREEQIGQARKLALLGDRDFYQTAKDLLSEDGRWPEEYPEFLAELKAAWPASEYMEILKLEGETARLMEQIRLQPETVFHYGAALVRQYKQEIFGLCAAVIRKQAEQTGNRKRYQKLCGMLESLAELGGQAEAQALIAELRQAYPRRWALMDELEWTAQALAGK